MPTAPRKTTKALPKKTKGTGASFVHEALRRAILTLELEPGTVLDEVAIGAQYGVSRSPVREAMVKLAATGLVETQPNRPAMVARIGFETVASFLAAQEVVYRLTARGAAKRRRPDDITRLTHINTRHETLRAAGDAQGMVELNREFHLAIARIAGNVWYERWLYSLMDEGQRMMRLYMRSLGSEVPSRELKHHRELIAAIEAGDPDAADEAGRLDADVIRRQLSAMLAESSVGVRLNLAAE